MTRKELPDGDYDPRTATFLGRFVTAVDKQEAHAGTVALYQNDKGEFFTWTEERSGPDHKIATNPTSPIPGTRVEVIDDPEKWLREQFERLQAAIAEGPAGEGC